MNSAPLLSLKLRALGVLLLAARGGIPDVCMRLISPVYTRLPAAGAASALDLQAVR